MRMKILGKLLKQLKKKGYVINGVIKGYNQHLSEDKEDDVTFFIGTKKNRSNITVVITDKVVSVKAHYSALNEDTFTWDDISSYVGCIYATESGDQLKRHIAAVVSDLDCYDDEDRINLLLSDDYMEGLLRYVTQKIRHDVRYWFRH